jgi:hypothetical protein
LTQKQAGQACSSLIEADENRLGESMLARFAFDIAARRLLADRQAIHRQRKEPEMAMVRAVAARRTWAAMAESPEIIDGLLEGSLFGLFRGARGKGRPVGRDIIGCPVMPRSRRRIGIIAQKDKAAGPRWSVTPLERWGYVIAVAGEALRNGLALSEGRRAKPHDFASHGDTCQHTRRHLLVRIDAHQMIGVLHLLRLGPVVSRAVLGGVAPCASAISQPACC